MSETEERIERFAVATSDGGIWEVPFDQIPREEAEEMAAGYDDDFPDSAPHRVVHLVELRPGERIVREEEVPPRDDGTVWVKVSRELLPKWREWSEPLRVRIIPREEFAGAAEMELRQLDITTPPARPA